MASVLFVQDIIEGLLGHGAGDLGLSSTEGRGYTLEVSRGGYVCHHAGGLLLGNLLSELNVLCCSLVCGGILEVLQSLGHVLGKLSPGCYTQSSL